MPDQWPDVIAVQPAKRALRGMVEAPPSKNYAARFLWTSLWCEGTTRLTRVPGHDDGIAMARVITALGARLSPTTLTATGLPELKIEGIGGIPLDSATLDMGNAGAVTRFALSAAALGGVYRYETDSPHSLGKRPNLDLLKALESWGVVTTDGGGDEGTLPLTLDGTASLETDCDETSVSGAISSQFLSSLLMIAPVRALRRDRPQTINLDGELRSRPAVETTLDVMTRRGVEVNEIGPGTLCVEPGLYAPGKWQIPGDWPGALAILGAAAVVPNSSVMISGLEKDAQGERSAMEALAQAGCHVEHVEDGVILNAPKRLRAFLFNGDLATDAVPALVAVAALCEGTSRISGVANLKYKESDRLQAPIVELKKVGVEAKWDGDALVIEGKPDGVPGDVTIHGYSDHRMIMMGIILGLRAAKPLRIDTVPHIKKSYPGFLSDLTTVGVSWSAAS